MEDKIKAVLRIGRRYRTTNFVNLSQISYYKNVVSVISDGVTMQVKHCFVFMTISLGNCYPIRNGFLPS